MNVSKTITLTGSDTDGNTLSCAVVTAPAHGTLTCSMPVVTYVPVSNYYGSDSFTFKVNDGVTDSVPATVSITILQTNTPPVAYSQSVTTPEDTPITITLTASDTEGNALTYAIVTQTTKGILTGTAPNLVYTPNTNINGSDSFTFQVNDGTTNSSIATVSITITPVNDPPVAHAQSITTYLNARTNITLTASDVDGNPITYAIVTAPGHGALTGSSPNVTYVPISNYVGSDSFTFKANDGMTDSSPAAVTITVISTNGIFFADDFTRLTNPGTLSPWIAIQGTWNVTGGVLQGTCALQAYGNVYLTNNWTDYSVQGQIQFPSGAFGGGIGGRLDPATGKHYGAWVYPEGSAGGSSVLKLVKFSSWTTWSGTPMQQVSLPGVGTNWNTLKLVFQGNQILIYYNGSQVMNATDNGFDGTSAYSSGGISADMSAYPSAYTMSVDSVVVSALTATLTNHAPVANNQSLTTPKNVSTNLTLTATDVDGDALTYAIVTAPAHGSLTGTLPTVTYVPVSNYVGSDSFTFKANDGQTDSAPATVLITITPLNHAPVANNQSLTTPKNVSTNLTLTATDADGDALTYAIVTAPAHGSLTGSLPTVTYVPVSNYVGGDSFTFQANDGQTDSAPATVSISVTPLNHAPVANNQSLTTPKNVSTNLTLTATDVDGDALTYAIVTAPAHGSLTGSLPTVTYVPVSNYVGSDSFTFKANDGQTDSAPATVSISVTPLNHAPVANNQSLTTPKNVSTNLTLTATDVDGDALTYAIVSAPAHGSLTGSLPTVTYVPVSNYVGGDSFTFKANDGQTDSAPATVLITITPLNHAPVANSLSVTTPKNVSTNLTLTATDVDGDALTYAIVTAPAHGSLTGSLPTVTYVPVSNYVGGDSFTFKANDGQTDSAPATVSISITPLNHAPVANNQSLTTPKNVSTNLTLTATDVDGDALTYAIVTAPAHGSLTGSLPTVTYVPVSNYVGGDSFTFKANDGQTNSAPATVSISITPLNHAPVANNQSLTTPKNVSTNLTLTATDVDGDALTYAIVTAPAHGSLTGSPPTVTYVPVSNYVGSDSFTFQANDGQTNSVPATVLITITPLNHAPVANSLSVTTPKNVSTNLTLTATDVDGDALTYAIVTAPAHGSLTGSLPTVTYVPVSNYVGGDSFTFQANDGQTNSVPATVSITITPLNHAPVANSQSLTTLKNLSTNLTLTATDADGDALTYAIVTAPAHGSLTGSPPTVTYVPVSNYVGSDSFTFKANDGQTNSAPATVSITVTPLNHAPVANNQSLTTPKNVSTNLTLTATDVDGDALTYAIVTAPAHGSLTGSLPTVTYVPVSNYVGSDSFTFQANDGQTDSAPATVSITVTPLNHAPVANSLSVTTPKNVSTNLTLTATDADGDSLTYAIVSAPAHGSLTGSLPTVTYVPVSNYVGSDSFTFKANDGQTDSAPATVLITITPLNHAPVANSLSVTTPKNVSTNLTLTATDADGDSLTYAIVSAPAHGSLTGSLPTVTYVPVSNYVGSDSFTFQANDGQTNSVPATVLITITPLNHAPVANSLSVTTPKNVSTNLTLTATDVDGDALTYAIVTAPAHGSLTGSLPTVTYVPVSNYVGGDSFTFQANDGQTNSVPATVSITITPLNHAPVANSQSLTTLKNLSTNLTLTATDADGDALTYAIVTAPAHGSLTGSPPTVTYVPVSNYVGSDSFTFKANDGQTNSAPATVSITVTPLNHAPVANNQSLTTPKNVSTNLTLTATDVDGDALTYAIVTAPAHGSLTGSLPTVTYVPVSNYVGSDSFTFQANDGQTDSAPATVSITVTPLNHAPVANNQSLTTPKNVSTNLTLTATDADGDSLTYAIVSAPAHGSLTGSLPTVTYVPVSNYVGSDSFTFKANDGQTDSAPATVLITITPLNHAPVANAQSVIITNGAATAVTLTGSDADGDPLTYSVLTSPAYGTLTGSAPNLVYTPANNYSGTDSFTFKVNDGIADSAPAMVSLTITAITNLPVVAIIAAGNAAKPDQAGSFLVSCSGSTASPLTVNYAISGTAQNGTDYVSIANSVTIPSGSALASIVIMPINNPAFIGDETVVLTIQTNTAYQIDSAKDTATVVIQDNGRPQLHVRSVTNSSSASPSITNATVAKKERASSVTQTNLTTAGKALEVYANGATNVAYVLQATTNLANWTIVKVGALGGAMDYIDANVNLTSQRFYRIVYLKGAISAATYTAALTNGDFSENIAGYVNVTVPPGYSLIVNPLMGQADDASGGLISPLPQGARIFKYNNGTYSVNLPAPSGTAQMSAWAVPNTSWTQNVGSASAPAAGWSMNEFQGGQWTDTNDLFNPGEGVFFLNPTNTNVRLTFVGDVLPDGSAVPLPAGYSIRGSVVPKAGRLDTVLGFPVSNGDSIFRFNNKKNAYVMSTFSKGTWDTPPSLSIGEAFFVFKQTATNWVVNLP